ncbi:lipase member M isoform X6 [Oryctolagus cuniculus]|uniref:lipase member M isoform X6 n=1 Tax=Oryctolagus cuniculus TaxID=9986 RepID=UPI0007EE722D|nr:lipase member M isoform X5 [Oryctolagus cuniculus]
MVLGHARQCFQHTLFSSEPINQAYLIFLRIWRRNYSWKIYERLFKPTNPSLTLDLVVILPGKDKCRCWTMSEIFSRAWIVSHRMEMWLLILVAYFFQRNVNSGHMPTKAVDPEAFMNISEIIQHKGYPCEEYEVTTEDGYILSVNRIPQGLLHAKKAGFIAFSTMPELAQKIKMYFALAPIATVKYAKSPGTKFLLLPDMMIKGLFGKKEFLYQTRFLRQLVIYLCGQVILDQICSNIILLLGGFNTNNMNMSRANVYVAHSPAGTSVQNILHWSQAVNSGELRAFDWGSETKNLEKCNQPTPIRYKVSDMTVPTAMWTGGQDWLSNPEDVKTLLSEVTNLIYHKNIPEWAHVDFIWGLDAPDRVYNEIIHLMKQEETNFSQGSCKVTL